LKGAEPFYFKKPSHTALVILVHGFTSSCHSMRELGERLFDAGFDAAGILLPGHGTTANDMEKKKWTEWYEAVENKLIELRPRYTHVFLCGQSMGGCLSLYTASFHSVNGVITISSGLKIFDWKLSFLRVVKYFVRFIKKHDGPDINDPVAKAKEVHYDLMPVTSIIELQHLLDKLRERMALVTCPVLLIHARHDHTFDFKNQKMMFDTLGSPTKKIVVLENSYHVATVDYDKATIHKETIEFIKDLCR
jgi:carboxylesterase